MGSILIVLNPKGVRNYITCYPGIMVSGGKSFVKKQQQQQQKQLQRNYFVRKKLGEIGSQGGLGRVCCIEGQQRLTMFSKPICNLHLGAGEARACL